LGDFDIEVTDAALNEGSPDSSFKFDQVNVTGGSKTPNVDTSEPRISNVTVLNETIQAGNRLIVTADVADKSGIESVQGTYFIDSFPSELERQSEQEGTNSVVTTRFTLRDQESQAIDNGSIRLSTTVPEDTLSGRYRFGFIEATDTIGNRAFASQLSPLTQVQVQGKNLEKITQNLSDAPEVTDISVINDSVEPGSAVSLQIETASNSQLSNVSAFFQPVIQQRQPGILPDEIEANRTTDFESSVTTPATVSIEIPKSTPNGTIQLESLQATTPENRSLFADPIDTTPIQIGVVDPPSQTPAPVQVDVDINTLSGNGTSTDPYEISNVSELQAMEDDLDANYTLASNIDASQTAQFNNGSGFDPVGEFTGSLDGDNHTITGLTINRPSQNDVGLFQEVAGGATLRNITLTDLTVTGDGSVGGLAGENGGTIQNATVSGSVTGDFRVGGLIGFNLRGKIINATASGNVSGNNSIGGLAGQNNGQFGDGEIKNASASGNVTATFDRVGGLVGNNFQGTIQKATASGSVTGTEQVGGLVGKNNRGDVTTTRASGSVNGTREAGGLVGDNEGTVTNATATGNVTGDFATGGLVGYNDGRTFRDGIIQNATASGSVTGTSNVGGLAGNNVNGTVTIVRASGNVIGNTDVGGLVGINVGTITIAQASGSVEGNQRVGGLVGKNRQTVQETFSVGSVDGGTDVGGLIGNNTDTPTPTTTSTAIGTSTPATTSTPTSTPSLTGTSTSTPTESPSSGTVTQSYFDEQATEQSTSAGNATGLTTTQMQGESAKSNMNGLAFGTSWQTQTDPDDYPTLLALQQGIDESQPSEVSLSALSIAGEGPEIEIEDRQDTDANVSVSVNVTNVGDVTKNFTVTAEVSDSGLTQSLGVNLPTGATEQLVFEKLNTSALTTRETPFNVIVSTTNDSVTGNITILAPGQAEFANLSIAGQGTEAEIIQNPEAETGADVPVSVNVTNIGDVTENFTVTAELAGKNGTGTDTLTQQLNLTLSADETDRLTFDELNTSTLAARNQIVAITVSTPTANDSLTGNVSILEPGQVILTNLSIAGQGSDAEIVEDTNQTISVDVTNIGDVADNFTVTAEINTEDADTPTQSLVTENLSANVTQQLAFDGLDIATLPVSEEPFSVAVSTTNEKTNGTVVITDSSPFAGGSGTENDPFQIATAEQFDSIRSAPNNDYELISDIDLNQLNDSFTPITGPFTGSIDGNGHSLSGIELSTAAVSSQPVGVFSETEKATVSEIRFVSPTVSIGNQQTNASVGILAGVARDTKVTDAVVTDGTVTITEPERISGVGGLLGNTTGVTTVMDSSLDTEVRVIAANGEISNVGGVAGKSDGEFTFVNTTVSSEPIVNGNANITDTGGLIGRTDTLSVSESNITVNGTVAIQSVTGDSDSTGADSQLQNVGGIVGAVSSNLSVTETVIDGDIRAGTTEAAIGSVGGVAGASGEIIATEQVQNRINTTVISTAGTAAIVGGWIGDASDATIDINASYSRSATTVGTSGFITNVGHFAGILRTDGTIQSSSIDGVLTIGGPANPSIANRTAKIPLNPGSATRANLALNIGGVAGTATQPSDTEPEPEGVGTLSTTDSDPRGLTVNRTVTRVDQNIQADDSTNIGRFSGRLIGKLDLSDVFLGGVIEPLELLGGEASGIVNDAGNGTITTDDTTFDGARGPRDPGPIDAGSPSDDPDDVPPALDNGNNNNQSDNIYPSVPDEPDINDSPRDLGQIQDFSTVTGTVELTAAAKEEIGAGEVTVTVDTTQRNNNIKLDILNSQRSYEIYAPKGTSKLSASVEATDTTATFEVTPVEENITVDSETVDGPRFNVDVNDTEFDGFEVRADELFANQDLRFKSQLAAEADVLVDRVEWDFGDGTQAEGSTAVHAYESPGEYDVSLTLFGVDGERFTATDNVTIQSAPNVTITDISLVADGETVGPADQVSIPNPDNVPIGYNYVVTVEDSSVLDDFNATVGGKQVSSSNVTQSGDTFTVELGANDLSQGTPIRFEIRGSPGEEFAENESAVETRRDAETIAVSTFNIPPFVLTQTSADEFDFDDSSIVIGVDVGLPPSRSSTAISEYQIPVSGFKSTTGFNKTALEDPPATSQSQKTESTVSLVIKINPVERSADVTVGGDVEHDLTVVTVTGKLKGTGHLSLEEPRFDGATVSGGGGVKNVILPPPEGFPLPPFGQPQFEPAFGIEIFLVGNFENSQNPDESVPIDFTNGSTAVNISASQAIAVGIEQLEVEGGFEQRFDNKAPLPNITPININGKFNLFVAGRLGPIEQKAQVPSGGVTLYDATLGKNSDSTGQTAVFAPNDGLRFNRSSEVRIATITGEVPPPVTGTAEQKTSNEGRLDSVSPDQSSGDSIAATTKLTRVTQNAVDDENPDVTTVAGQNETLAVWSRQRSDEPAADGRDIVFDRLNNEANTPFENVTDNDRSEFKPAIAGPSADNHLIAATQLSNEFDDREVDNLNQVLTQTDIAVTRPNANGWTQPIIITDKNDTIANGGPTLAYNDGQWLLAWESRVDGLDGQAEDFNVNYVWFDDDDDRFNSIDTKTISAARAPDVAPAPDDGFHLAYADLGPGTVADADADRRHGSVTVETFDANRSNTQTKQYSVTRFADLDVTTTGIGWIDANTSEPVSLANRPNASTGFGAVTSPPINPPSVTQSIELESNNNTLIVTTRGTASETGISRTSYTARVDNNWVPTRVYADGSDQNITYRQATSASTTSGFVTAFAGKEIRSEQRYDVFAFNQTFTPDLNVSVTPGPNTNLDSLSVNDTATFRYTVTNDGAAASPNTSLVVTANETQLTTDEITAIEPGRNTTGTVTIPVTETGDATLTLDPEENIDDINRSNNAETIQLIGNDVVVNEISISDTDSVRTINTTITNPTGARTDPVDVRFENGPELNRSNTIAALAPGESRHIAFTASPAAFDTAYPVVIETRPTDTPLTAPTLDRKAATFAPDLQFSAETITFYESDGKLIADVVIENRGPVSVSGTLAGAVVSDSDASLTGGLDATDAPPNPEAITTEIPVNRIQSVSVTPASSGSTNAPQFTRTTLSLGDLDTFDQTTDVVGLTLTANGTVQDAATVPITDGTTSLSPPGDVPPSGDINASTTTITLGETVTLRVANISSPTSEVETFKWDVEGEEVITNQSTVSVTPTEIGETEVGLVIQDTENRTERVSTTITVESPPNITLESVTANQSVISEAQTVSLTATVTSDAESDETVQLELIRDQDGQQLAQSNVDLNSGATQVVTFNVTPDETTTFSIQAPTATPNKTITIDVAELTLLNATIVTQEPVTTDETAVVNATVSNTGTTTGFIPLTLRQNGTTVDSTTQKVPPSETVTAQLTASLPEGTQNLTVTSSFGDGNANGNKSATAGEVVIAPPAVTTNATVGIESASVGPGGTTDVNLTVDQVPKGLAVYNLTVKISVAASAAETNDVRVVEATAPSIFNSSVTETTIGPENQTAEIRATDITEAVEEDATNTSLGTVTVAADESANVSQTELTVSISRIDDDRGTPINVTELSI
jgi:hypothetical protein